MHWENSGPKQAAWTQTTQKKDSRTHKLTLLHSDPSTNTTSISTHTHSRCTTRSRRAFSCRVTLEFSRFTSSKMAFLMLRLNLCLISWSIKGTVHHRRPRSSSSSLSCWDCQFFCYSSPDSSRQRGPSHYVFSHWALMKVLTLTGNDVILQLDRGNEMLNLVCDTRLLIVSSGAAV